MDATNPSTGKMHQLLSAEERARLAVIASVVRFKKGDEIYRDAVSAEAVFNIIGGLVEAFQQDPNGTEQIMAFLIPEELFALVQGGRYANSIKTPTPVTAHRIPVTALRRRLLTDAAR